MPETITDGPPWDEGATARIFPLLPRSTTAEVVVIGGGLTGMLTAYLAVKSGLDVVVLEKDRIGHGATGVTTAFVAQIIDTDIATLISMLGVDTAKTVIASHGHAIELLENIVAAEKIACDFERCMNYIYANDASEEKALKKELTAAARVDLPMMWHDDDDLGIRTAGYLALPNQAKFHPLKFLHGLAQHLADRGVRIYESTEADEIRAGDNRVVRTNRGDVAAKHVVVATYAPFDGKLHFKKAFYDTYVYELQVPSGHLPAGIYEDTQLPYHYLRVDRGTNHDRVIIGGEDHRHDIPVADEKNFTVLRRYIDAAFADIPYTVVRQWQGPILETVDGRAFIGALADPYILYATGFSGTGMTYAMLAAEIMVDTMQGSTSRWAALYPADRTPSIKHLAYKGRDYTKELFGGAVANTFTPSKKI